ncbi:amidase [Yinghuangia seranimata]|uniref:amidase n=1 Tax=Yinghuangia seranimata TaxID=408067 RepID=UPI00248B0988|nr:amidase [Yinghuangia seranimata]MDI2125483.1 amidase [Yinghuangia seranimata]
MSTLSATDVDTVTALDATAQAALVRDRHVTVEELVTAAIARIERLNPALNAVITPTFEQALAQARAGLPDGPFTGVPYLIKDLATEQEGVRFTEGSAYLRGNVSRHDQELVRRLRAAGLVLLGKTNTPEFGMAPTCEPVLYGPTRNPWDPARTTGGSSGGSAAAVAARMVPAAHGNDAGGSIRFPASCCGLFGLKPNRARVPLGPAYGDAFGGWAAEHALTRSVRDSAALLDAVAGPAPGDPYTAPPAPGPFAAEVDREPGLLRIAYSLTASGGHPVHPDCAAALEDAVGLCADLGHDLVEQDLPGLGDEVGEAIGTVYYAAMDWIVAYWTRELGRPPAPGELEPYTRAYWEHSRRVTGGDYLLAVTTLQAFARTVADFLTGYDAWLTPTLAQPPLLLGEMTSSEDDPWRTARNSSPFVAFPAIAANITGGPAMSVPLYWSREGLPIGVHFLGRVGDEATLFRLAGQLERARPWAGRVPPAARTWPARV